MTDTVTMNEATTAMPLKVSTPARVWYRMPGAAPVSRDFTSANELRKFVAELKAAGVDPEIYDGLNTVRAIRADRHAGTSTSAILSFIFSMLWLGGVGSIIGIVLGHHACNEIHDTDRRFSGVGLATAGMVLGWIGIAAAGAWCVSYA